MFEDIARVFLFKAAAALKLNDRAETDLWLARYDQWIETGVVAP